MIAGGRFHRLFYLCVVLTSAAPIACVCGWAEVSLSACASSLYGSRPYFVPSWFAALPDLSGVPAHGYRSSAQTVLYLLPVYSVFKVHAEEKLLPLVYGKKSAL